MVDFEREDRLQQKKSELQQKVLEYLTPDQVFIVQRVEEMYMALKDTYAPNCKDRHDSLLKNAIELIPGGQELYQYMQWISQGLKLSPYFIELTYPEDPDDWVRR